MENVNRHERRNRATAERKLHYRMYKAGKKWVFAGVAVLSMGGALVIDNQSAQAATDSAPASTQLNQADADSDAKVKDQSGADAAQNDPAKSDVAAADPTDAAQTDSAADANAEAEQQTQQDAAQDSEQADAAATSGADTATDNTANSGAAASVDATDTADKSTDATADAQAKTTAADEQTPDANTNDVAHAVSTAVSAVNAQVQTGNRAGYTLSLNTTGIKTTLHQAKLVLNLPAMKGITLANTLSSLAVAGVTPTVDSAAGTLTYDFGTLDSGLSAKINLAFDTDRALTTDTSVALSGQLSSEETTQDIAPATIQLVSTPKGGVTNVIAAVTGTSTADNHVNPIQGDTVTFNFGAWIPTSQAGTTLVKAGSQIEVDYKLAAGLNYMGMGSGSDIETTAPTITPNADGTTSLTWFYTADGADAQVTSDFIKKYLVQAQITSTIVDWATLTTSANMNFTDASGQQQYTQQADATFTVTPQNIREKINQDGVYWAPLYTYNSYSGAEEAAGDANTNPDPTVYTEASPLLYRWLYTGSNVAGNVYPGENYVYYAVHNQIDPNESIQTLYIDPATFWPDSSVAEQPLTDYPYITLAVKYSGEGNNTYHVLTADINTAKTTVLTRADLVALGLDPTQAVTDLYLYYHMSATPSAAIPANVDTFFTDGAEAPGADAAGKPAMVYIAKTTADYTGFPSDSGAPMGIRERIGIVTSVNSGFTGTITHSSMAQMDDGHTDYGIYWDRYLDAMDYAYSEDAVTINSIKPSTVEVTNSPTGVERDVDAAAGLTNSAANSVIEAGKKNLTVQFTLGQNSTANLVTTAAPLSAYAILPKGVTLDSTQNANATLVTADYQGTGQQLVKVSFGQYILPVGQTLQTDIPVVVSDDAPTDLAFKVYLDLGDNAYTVTSLNGSSTAAQAAVDSNDLNGNGDTTDNLVAVGVNYVLAQTNKVQTEQTITGSGTTAAGIAETTLGGQATVTITTSADTDVNISSLDLLDVLPQKGAQGLTTTDSRATDYALALAGPITLPSAWDGQVTVTYSSAKAVDPADASQWQNAAAVTDWPEVTAFRIQLAADSGKVIPGGAQTLSFKVLAPNDPSAFTDGVENIADNSYSLSVNGLEATEPHAAQLAVTPVTINHGTYTTTRTIHYQTADGKTLKADTVQTMTYRTVSSSADGRTIYTPSSVYAGFTPEAIEGYTTDATVPTVTPGATDVQPTNTEYTVVYQANAIITGSYKTTRTIHFVDEGGQTVHPDVVQTLTYKTVTDQQSGRTIYTPAGIYASLAVPTVANHTASQTRVAAEAKGATDVQPSDEAVTIVYTKNGGTTTPGGNGGTTTPGGNGGTTTPGGNGGTTTPGGNGGTTTPGGNGGTTTPGGNGGTTTPGGNGGTTTPGGNGGTTTPGGNGGTTTPGGNGGTTTPGGNGGTTTPGGNGGTTTPGGNGGTTTPGGNGGTTTPGNNGGSTPGTNGGHVLPSTGGEITTPVATGHAVTSTNPTRGSRGLAVKQSAPVKRLVSSSAAANQRQTLPQTGDGDAQTLSFIGLALAGLVGMLGLGKKRRRED